MSRTEDAIAALIVATLGKDAPAQDIKAYRGVGGIGQACRNGV